MADHKWFLILGAFMGFVSVAAGAFGAHALKHRLTPDMLGIFEVGARYQMYHSLALCMTAILMLYAPLPFFAYSGWLFFLGSAIFSGTLYLLAVTGVKWLGAITPVGGIVMLAGWLFLLLGALRLR